MSNILHIAKVPSLPQDVNNAGCKQTEKSCMVFSNGAPTHDDPEKVRYKVIGVEMKGMESSMKLVALGATQRKG